MLFVEVFYPILALKNELVCGMLTECCLAKVTSTGPIHDFGSEK